MAQMPPGNYSGKLVRMYTDRTPNTGSDYVGLEFELTHEYVGDEWVEVEPGTHRTVSLFLTEASEPYTIDKLEFLGFNPQASEYDAKEGVYKSPTLDNVNADAVALYCKHEEYKGKMQERWDISTLTDSSKKENKPVDLDTVKAFEAKLRQRRENSTRPAGKPKPVAPVTDDEIPQDVSDEECPF